MKIIVGLGNPGKEYENTRHNIGFRVVDHINKRYPEAEPSARYGAGGGFRFDKKTNSEIAEVKIDGRKVLLVKPQTFMNNSGEALKKLVKSRKLKPESFVVVHDDLDVLFGKVKLSFARGSAGHRGVESVIRALKTDKFFRVRFGTSGLKLAKIRNIKDKRKRIREMNDFVVGPFTPSEKQKLNKLIKIAAEKALR